MYIDFFIERFRNNQKKEAIIWHDKVYNYENLLNFINQDMSVLKDKISNSSIVSIEGDFSPRSVSVLFCLIELGCIIVPITKSVEHKKAEFKSIAQIEISVIMNDDDSFEIVRENREVNHEILKNLKTKHHPGLILFSSGSTGESKAAVHDFLPLLEKFKVERKAARMMTFLLLAVR